jgi:signal transduction histidine kinase
LFWSWHRLNYINRFLEREHSKSEVQNSRRQTNDNAALVDFFESAIRHLPLKAWRFSAGTDMYSGGYGLPERRVSGGDDAWALSDNVYARRYPGRQSLHIEFAIDHSAEGVEITELIDSLSRVRAREQTSLFNDSIERLQTNAQILSEQLEWLRSVKAFSDSMLAGSPAGFAVWNAAGECVRANDLAYQLVPGFSENAELLEFIHCIDSDDHENKQYLQNLLLECKPWQVTYRKEEREIIINFRAVGNKLSNRLVCASIIDVSDIRTSERARAEMVEYLSHDLRSPLISALYLLDKNDDPRIESNINNSLSMMDNLLHVARADSLSEEQFQPLLLNAVLDNALDQLLPQALSRKIAFDIDTDDNDLWVNGDAASLERAFANIVGNAIKYSPEGSKVSVKLHRRDSMVELTIDDQGIGIAPDMLGKLFSRFKRDESTAGDIKGIGLGLALVSRVVNLHNGKVEASNLTKGTRITLQLPLEDSLLELTA